MDTKFKLRAKLFIIIGLHVGSTCIQLVGETDGRCRHDNFEFKVNIRSFLQICKSIFVI